MLPFTVLPFTVLHLSVRLEVSVVMLPLAGLILGLALVVTSRQVVWLFFKQLWFEFVPVLHGLQGRFTAQG